MASRTWKFKTSVRQLASMHISDISDTATDNIYGSALLQNQARLVSPHPGM